MGWGGGVGSAERRRRDRPDLMPLDLVPAALQDASRNAGAPCMARVE